MVELLCEPIQGVFFDLLAKSKRVIRLCAPYIKSEIVNNIYFLKGSTVDVIYVSNFCLPNLY